MKNMMKEYLGNDYTENHLKNFCLYWMKAAKGYGDEWRAGNDLDCLYFDGNLRADTLMSAWTPIKWVADFVNSESGIKFYKRNEEYALANLDEIFDGYEGIRRNLDKLADYHHSLANMMPAPVGLNGSRSHDGKGNFLRDNDMPDIYYKRAEKDFPQMYRWINDHMEDYSLQIFKEYESYCSDGHANAPVSDDPVELVPFEHSVDNAIACIEWRAMKVFNSYCKRQDIK